MKISSMRSCLQISLELSRYARHDPLRLLKVKLCKLDTSYSLACVISTNFKTHLNPSVKFLSDKKRISNSGPFPPLFRLIWHLIPEKIICTKLISFQFGTIFQYLSRLIYMYNNIVFLGYLWTTWLVYRYQMGIWAHKENPVAVQPPTQTRPRASCLWGACPGKPRRTSLGNTSVSSEMSQMS